MGENNIKSIVSEWLRQAGAVAVGVTNAETLAEEENRLYRQWVAEGNNAGMSYLERNTHLRENPSLLLENAKSIICMAFPFSETPENSKIAGYALGDDYHDIIRKLLTPITKKIETSFNCHTRICIDSAPLAERSYALRSGIGTRCKNGMIYVPKFGNRVFLAEILLDIELPEDTTKINDGCLQCDACVKACPAGALKGNGLIDARICLSYLTIEHKGKWDDRQLTVMHTEAGKNTLFGCDICLQVCPLNKHINHNDVIPSLRPRKEIATLSANEAASLDQISFSRLFANSAIKRCKLEGLRRNAFNVIGSSETGRFAPSPTGRMHLGNVFAALMSWLEIKSISGKWIVRYEDIDPDRSRPEYIDLISEDLLWLGLMPDEIENRSIINSDYYRQSARTHLYKDALQQLVLTGKVYPCHCRRADIMATQAPHQSDGRIVYAGTCRPKSLGGSIEDVTDISKVKDKSLRLFVPDRDIIFHDLVYGRQNVNLDSHCGDFVLRRADGAWAYQLAVVVDDAEMGVTRVVRGNDLLLSTAQQIYLYELLQKPVPLYMHIPLICAPDGRRLSKRDKDLDMDSLRRHLDAKTLLGKLAMMCGLKNDASPVTPQELLDIYTLNRNDIIKNLNKNSINVNAAEFLTI